MQEEKENDLNETETDPIEEQIKELEELEQQLGAVSPSTQRKERLIEEWKAIEQVLKTKHLDFNDDNLKEFSDLYGEEFINLLSKRNLQPEERKLFNLALRVRLTNLIQTIVFEKAVKEVTANNTAYFEKLNEKLYLENEAAVNNLIDDLQARIESHGQAIRSLAKADTLDLQTKKEELVDAVRNAEQLRVDIAEQQERTLKAISKALKKDIHGLLEPGLEKILEGEKKKRRLFTSKTFKRLFIVFGIAFFLLGATIYQLIK